MIDTNVDLFQWPFRRVAGDDPASLVTHLRSKGVTQAWACSYQALLMRDVAGVNIRLAEACRKHGPGFLLPFGNVNPKEPDWQEDVRRCAEVHHMPGIRLRPQLSWIHTGRSAGAGTVGAGAAASSAGSDRAGHGGLAHPIPADDRASHRPRAACRFDEAQSGSAPPALERRLLGRWPHAAHGRTGKDGKTSTGTSPIRKGWAGWRA